MTILGPILASGDGGNWALRRQFEVEARGWFGCGHLRGIRSKIALWHVIWMSQKNTVLATEGGTTNT